MKFEFDPAKSKLNKLKHGVDFIEAHGDMVWAFLRNSREG